jgi:hypothetical protein
VRTGPGCAPGPASGQQTQELTLDRKHSDATPSPFI